MSGLLSARAWGVGVGSLCMVLAACAPSDLPSSKPLVGITVVTPESGPMSLKQKLQALSARARVERKGKAPMERIFREFDLNGNVVSEDVIVNGRYQRRQSTLPPAIASRELSTFLPTGPAIFDTTTATVVGIASSYDSTTAADTIVSSPPDQMQFVSHTTDQPYDALAATYYYSSVANTGDPAYSIGADVWISTSTGYMEITATGDITNPANWGEFSYLRASVSDSGGMSRFGGMANMTQYDSCAAQKQAVVGATARFVAVSVLAAAATFWSFGITGGAAASAVGLAGADMVSKQTEFIYCRSLHPIA
jgi:hypothetical protein